MTLGQQWQHIMQRDKITMMLMMVIHHDLLHGQTDGARRKKERLITASSCHRSSVFAEHVKHATSDTSRFFLHIYSTWRLLLRFFLLSSSIHPLDPEQPKSKTSPAPTHTTATSPPPAGRTQRHAARAPRGRQRKQQSGVPARRTRRRWRPRPAAAAPASQDPPP